MRQVAANCNDSPLWQSAHLTDSPTALAALNTVSNSFITLCNYKRRLRGSWEDCLPLPKTCQHLAEFLQQIGSIKSLRFCSAL